MVNYCQPQRPIFTLHASEFGLRTHPPCFPDWPCHFCWIIDCSRCLKIPCTRSADNMEGCIRRPIDVQSTLRKFISAVRYFFLAQRYFVAGIKIISPNVADCLNFRIGTITGSFHNRWLNGSKNNKSAMEKRRVISSNIATGGILSRESSGGSLINALAMWDFMGRGV